MFSEQKPLSDLRFRGSRECSNSCVFSSHVNAHSNVKRSAADLEERKHQHTSAIANQNAAVAVNAHTRRRLQWLRFAESVDLNTRDEAAVRRKHQATATTTLAVTHDPVARAVRCDAIWLKLCQ